MDNIDIGMFPTLSHLEDFVLIGDDDNHDGSPETPSAPPMPEAPAQNLSPLPSMAEGIPGPSQLPIIEPPTSAPAANLNNLKTGPKSQPNPGNHHPSNHHLHPSIRTFPDPSQAFLYECSGKLASPKVFLRQAILLKHPKAVCYATGSPYVYAFSKDPDNKVQVTPHRVTKGAGPPIVEYQYIPPSHRLFGDGDLEESVNWGRYDLVYENEPFYLYLARWPEGNSEQTAEFVLHKPTGETQTAETSKNLVRNLLLRACKWQQELRNEVWVFDQGYWQKDKNSWQGMQKANWDDVILPHNLKSSLRGDVNSFFKSKATYEDIGIAWKRGIIVYGPPGNGKTTTIKAIMKEIYHSLPMSPIPTLYVRSLSYGGEQLAMKMVFEKARSLAPCLLVLEDLDSLITPMNRSFFLNQMDGLDDNNGILVIGSTNHLNLLDPGIMARPSRFDRKYEFGLPGIGYGGRPTYVEYWK